MIESEPAPRNAVRLTRVVVVGAVVWLALLLCFQIFFGEITDWLTPFLAAPLWLLVFVSGLALAIAGAAGAWVHRRNWRSALVMLLAIPSAYLLLHPLVEAGLYGRFLVQKPSYDEQVAALEANPGRPAEEWQRANRNVRIEEGPPRRIAFVTWGGIPDPWGAIVHDPARSLDQPGHRRRFLFNSSVVSCRHLRDSYFRCSFS